MLNAYLRDILIFMAAKRAKNSTKNVANCRAREPNKQDAIAYTQGLMDLGATVCTRSQTAML